MTPRSAFGVLAGRAVPLVCSALLLVGAALLLPVGAVDDFSVANGCNIINTGFITTGAGVLVVNAGVSRRSGEQLRALIARSTREPVVQVLLLNLHPDYFLGHQAFADVPIAATAATRAGIQREANASHGPVHDGPCGLQQTRDYLHWLDARFSRWAAAGWQVNEVLRAAPPEVFTRWAAWPAEYTRKVAHRCPRYERAALQRSRVS